MGWQAEATSYDSRNSVVNQVQNGYDGFGQLTIEY
jgi:hypothetical protein